MLITLLVYLCILAIVWWVINMLPLPPPFKLVASVIFAIIAILMLLNLVDGGGFGLGYHRPLL
jgi:hypothetical protein